MKYIIDPQKTEISGISNETIFIIWNIFFMAPRIKIIVILNLFWSEFFETTATIQSVETDRNVAFVSKNSLQSKFKIFIMPVSSSC